MNEQQVEYPEGLWDDGMTDEVTVPCVRCGEPVRAEYDRGEPQTRDYPGDPGGWYVAEGQSCSHSEQYTSGEEAEFETACNRAAYATEA